MTDAEQIIALADSLFRKYSAMSVPASLRHRTWELRLPQLISPLKNKPWLPQYSWA